MNAQESELLETLEKSKLRREEKQRADELYKKIIDPAVGPTDKATALNDLYIALANINDLAIISFFASGVAEHRIMKEAAFKKRVKELILEPTNNTTEAKKPEPIYTAVADGIIDLVSFEGRPAFLVKDGAELSIEFQLERENRVFIPPPPQQIPWLLPRGEEILKLHKLQKPLSISEQDAALWSDLTAYHKSISDLPSEAYYDLIVAWDFHTYILEQAYYSPVICLFAVPERGKSRTGKGMIHVARNGIHVESMRDAYLVRVARDLQAAVFFDVKDIWKKAENTGTEDILLHRFEKGATVPRVLYPDRGAHRDIVYYRIFGPTIIATNEGVHRILETRAVQLNMPETERRFENTVTAELALPLKERLVLFRANHLETTFPDTPKPASGRLGDILKPLYQVIKAVKPEREKPFLELIKELEDSRLIDKSDTIEAAILESMIGLSDKVEGGCLPVKLIAEAFNSGKPEKSQVTYQRIGRRLAAMGFRKTRVNGRASIYWNEKAIEQMCCRYGMRSGITLQT